MSTSDGECPVRKCQETQGHAGPHRRVLHDLFGKGDNGRPVIVQAWVRAEVAPDWQPALVVDRCEVTLTWPQVDALVGVLGRASERFGS